MKQLLIVAAVFILSGCVTTNPAKTDQLILNVPAELLVPPAVLEKL